MKGSRNLLLFGSVILIFLAVGIVAILDRTKSPDAQSSDVRARASATGSLQFTAYITSVDPDKRIVVVDSLRFMNKGTGNTDQSLGTWTVSPPATFDLGTIASGAPVTLTVIPESFSVTSHTLTATDMKLVK